MVHATLGELFATLEYGQQWYHSCITIKMTYHVHKEGSELLCGLALPELFPLPVPLLLLCYLAHLHLPLMLLQACLDLLLVLLIWVQ